MRRLLLHGDGTWHDFPGLAAAYAESFGPAVVTDWTADAGRLSVAGLAGYDAVGLFPCLALGDDALTDKSRAALPVHAQRAVEDFVARGGAFLPLHGALVSWPAWDGLGRMAGMRWIWGVSAHDPQEDVAVRFKRSHPLWQGADDFTVFDEKYHALRPLRPVEILAESDWQGAAQPLAWTTTYGAGRVFYCALGHTPASVRHPAHAALLRRGAAWALGA